MSEQHQKSPRTVEEQSSPEPERLTTPQEEADMDLQQLDNPPQAEGPRDQEDQQDQHAYERDNRD